MGSTIAPAIKIAAKRIPCRWRVSANPRTNPAKYKLKTGLRNARVVIPVAIAMALRPSGNADAATAPQPRSAKRPVGPRRPHPIGPEGEQQLVRFTRKEQKIDRQVLGPVAFVPLLGGTA